MKGAGDPAPGERSLPFPASGPSWRPAPGVLDAGGTVIADHPHVRGCANVARAITNDVAWATDRELAGLHFWTDADRLEVLRRYVDR